LQIETPPSKTLPHQRPCSSVGLGRETVRKLVKDDPGVVKIRMGRKKAHTIYSVPESAAPSHGRLTPLKCASPNRYQLWLWLIVKRILRSCQTCLRSGTTRICSPRPSSSPRRSPHPPQGRRAAEEFARKCDGTGAASAFRRTCRPAQTLADFPAPHVGDGFELV